MNKGTIHPNEFNTRNGKLRMWWGQKGVCSCCERDSVIADRKGSYKGEPIYWCKGCMNAYKLFYKEAERRFWKENGFGIINNFYSDFIDWTHQEVLV